MALFETYPPHVVERAVSPVYGLPKIYKFIPRIAEIAEFLDKEMEPIWRQEKRDARTLMLPSPPIDRSKRKTYAELQELCARDGLIIGRGPPENRERHAAEFRAAHEVSDDIWNRIPDAKLPSNWGGTK